MALGPCQFRTGERADGSRGDAAGQREASGTLGRSGILMRAINILQSNACPDYSEAFLDDACSDEKGAFTSVVFFPAHSWGIW